MQRLASYPPDVTADFEAAPAFNVVMLYEDFETGKNAKLTYDYLVENLGPECRFTNQMWKFDVLSIPKLGEMAAKDASSADIVVFSSHGDALPKEVKEWTEQWLAEKRQGIALVALFDRSDNFSGGTPPARDYLAEVARRAQMDFFSQPDEWPGYTKAPEKPQQATVSTNQKALSVLAGAVQMEFTNSRWGINE